MKHRHLRTGFTYEFTGDGLVVVEDPVREISGRFRPDGSWHSGALRFADNHMIEFVLGTAAHTSPPRAEEAKA